MELILFSSMRHELPRVLTSQDEHPDMSLIKMHAAPPRYHLVQPLLEVGTQLVGLALLGRDELDRAEQRAELRLELHGLALLLREGRHVRARLRGHEQLQLLQLRLQHEVAISALLAEAAQLARRERRGVLEPARVRADGVRDRQHAPTHARHATAVPNRRAAAAPARRAIVALEAHPGLLYKPCHPVKRPHAHLPRLSPALRLGRRLGRGAAAT
eukprot:scaffold79735_cov64-Phaeocystis_antarctica.AAC.5